MTKRSYEIDMCNGPLFRSLLLFALPLLASNLLQLLFNAVDLMVAGNFVGSHALAAVGATTSLITVCTTLFVGIALGANVLAGRFYAQKDDTGMSEVVHTAITVAIIGGICVLFIGIILCRPALELVSTPEEVIDQSTLYMRIYFLGMPFFMCYNFGAAILRSIGDTRRPLYYLIFAGVCNVALNLILVLIFHLGVAGVAIGTVMSQFISSVLVLTTLHREQTSYHLDVKKLHLNTHIMKNMLRIGVPAGLQSMLINVSNVLIQSSVNTFGTLAIAGNTAGFNINGFLYFACNSVTQEALSFSSQNSGVGNYKRINKILFQCGILECIIGFGLGNLCYLFGHQILGLYASDPKVIAYGLINVAIICVPYGLCGLMDMIPGCIRGMGYSTVPMLLSLIGVVCLRFFWIFIIFPSHRSLETLYISYPVSWILTIGMQAICYVWVWRHCAKNEQVRINHG